VPNRILLDARHRKAAAHAARLKRQASAFLKKLNLNNAELSLALVGDAAIRKLNREWRRKDKPTDVLSFPADPLPRGVPGPQPLGDLVISLDTTARQAKEYGRTVEQELKRYLAHGLLHLLGHDHLTPKEAKAMSAAEEALLGEEGMVGDRVGE
jgi:probable rRNA maturation factor